MKPRPAKDFTAITCCTFCGSRNIFKPPIAARSKCTVCGRTVEFRSDIECPHCQAKPIRVSKGRDPEAGHFLMCSACNRQIADGIPLPPESATFCVWTLRLLAEGAARLVAILLHGPLWFQYQPKLARAQFQDLRTSWRSESYARVGERQGSYGHARTISQSMHIPARANKFNVVGKLCFHAIRPSSTSTAIHHQFPADRARKDLSGRVRR